ncbi:MAG: c-type cytochrome [Bacteroidetes bacterium]|nr:c-type cytochrome [Bacteroidota bacterium]
MKKYERLYHYSFLVFVIIMWSCGENSFSPSTDDDAEEAYLGGSTTSFDATSKAYTFPFSNILAETLVLHQQGDAVFETTFVSPPATFNSGLGPLYNNTSCKSCHVNDGRAKPLIDSEAFSGMLFRVSSTGVDNHGGPIPISGFGLQIQNKAVAGTNAEMKLQIQYEEITGIFADGQVYTLQRPKYLIIDSYIPFPKDALLSPRIANPNFGLGLLQAVSEETILSHADEYDSDGDGISGKPNYVYDFSENRMVLGRFGWKASQPTLLQQAAAAANGDMGITSTYFPEEASLGQLQDIPSHTPEMTADQLNALAIYLETLAPPARRNASDKTVLKGKLLFNQAQCAACHIPKLKTGTYQLAEISNQTIRPYTDLLLHDMGDGLADHRPDFRATGSEWRTPPLWGIGLTKIVNGHTNFLHDGRARNLIEAVLWHGGEAEQAKQNILKMTASDRNALIKFLESL